MRNTLRRWSVSVVAAAMYAGSGGSNAASPGSTAEAPVAAVSGAVALQQVSDGTVAFAVDNRPKQFDSLPDGDNNYTPLATTIRATPQAGAREHLMITIMSIDLRKLEYPIEIPLPRTAGPTVNLRMAMANVGFSYIDEAGREWAGPGRLRIERFGADGVVEGTFTGVSLPHTGKQLPKVTLTGGRFRARVSAPW